MLKTKIYLIQKILRIINQNAVNATMIYVFFIKIIFAQIANAYYVVNACRITLINA